MDGPSVGWQGDAASPAGPTADAGSDGMARIFRVRTAAIRPPPHTAPRPLSGRPRHSQLTVETLRWRLGERRIVSMRSGYCAAPTGPAVLVATTGALAKCWICPVDCPKPCSPLHEAWSTWSTGADDQSSVRSHLAVAHPVLRHTQRAPTARCRAHRSGSGTGVDPGHRWRMGRGHPACQHPLASAALPPARQGLRQGQPRGAAALPGLAECCCLSGVGPVPAEQGGFGSRAWVGTVSICERHGFEAVKIVRESSVLMRGTSDRPPSRSIDRRVVEDVGVHLLREGSRLQRRGR